MIVLAGVCGFRLLVLERLGAAGPLHWRDRTGRLLAAAGAVAGALLLPVGLIRLWAETYAIFGLDEGVSWEGVRIVLDSSWGVVWWVQMAGAAVVTAALAVGRKGRWLWWVAALATMVVTGSLAFTGHSMELSDRTLRIALQAIHVFGAALWIGMLAVLVFVLGGRDPDGPHPSVMVNRFSPAALAAVALLVVSGIATTVVYLETWSALWATWYGRTLGIKVLLFAGAGGFGAWNWRRLRPRLREDPAAREVLLGSARVELALAALVLAATAVLVGLPLEA